MGRGRRQWHTAYHRHQVGNFHRCSPAPEVDPREGREIILELHVLAGVRRAPRGFLPGLLGRYFSPLLSVSVVVVAVVAWLLLSLLCCWCCCRMARDFNELTRVTKTATGESSSCAVTSGWDAQGMLRPCWLAVARGV